MRSLIRSLTLCVAMVVMLFALYRRDWTHAAEMHSAFDSSDFPAIEVGLRDFHVHDDYDRFEQLRELFLEDGERIEAAGKRAFYAGWAAILACAIGLGLLRRDRPSASLRVALAVPQIASLCLAVTYTGLLGDHLHTFDAGKCSYLMPIAALAAGAAILWPRSSRSRSPAETLPPARAIALPPAPADAARAP